MAFINGFKYYEFDLAVNAQNICRINEGLPKENGETLQAVDILFADLNNPKFWYIIFCNESKILGNPINFEVIMPEINLKR